MSGWIKLHRELAEKSIWTCATLEQRSILITILIMANHKEKEWEWKGKRFKCGPGQFVTSSTKLAKKALVTRQNVRSSLVKFKKYEFLTYESTNTGLLITIVNWAKYQGCDNEPTNQLTSTQPTGNQRVTTNKNDKTLKNDKKLIPNSQVNMVFNFWNEQGIIVHKELTKPIISAIEKALKEHTAEEIQSSILHYNQMLNDTTYEYCSYKWTLINFLGREKGYRAFMDDGEKWINYQNRIKPSPSSPSIPILS